MSTYHHPPQNPPQIFSKLGVVILCVAVLVGVVLVQTLGVYLFAPFVLTEFADQAIGQAQLINLGSSHGTVISLAMLLTAVVTVVMVFGLVSWRLKQAAMATLPSQSEGAESKNSNGCHNNPDNRYNVRDYLALQPFAGSVAIALLGIWLIYLIFTELLTYLLDKNPTAFMDGLYLSAEPRWLLVVVIVLVVPIYEELVFRGILWSAIASQLPGRRGVWLASMVTSVLFAIVHAQYTWYEMTMVGILALIMSYARYCSGSLLLPILIHITNNAAAMALYIGNMHGNVHG